MTGAEIDRRIQKLLEKHPGIIGYRNPDSRMATVNGWPDWVFIGRRILFREIKGSNDNLSVDQRRVARAIMHARGDFQVWGPLDLLPGHAAEIQLSAIA